MLYLLPAVAGAAVTATVTAEEWARPRSGAALLAHAGLREVVHALDGNPDARVVVHYAGGDEGSLWAHELQAWLVALGLSSARIDLRPGNPESDSIQLSVTDGALEQVGRQFAPAGEHNR